MISLDLLIFDLDGTLVDSRKGIVKAVNHTLKRLSIEEKDFEEIVSYIGTGVKDLLRKSLGKENENLWEKSITIFEDYYQNHSDEESMLYPNVKDTLEHFKNKDKIILTNRKKKMAKVTLHNFGIDNYFKEIFGGSDDGCLKPSACPVDKLFSNFVFDKKKSIIIGDMDLDVLSGKSAGILTCAVTYGLGAKEDLIKSKPDFIVDDLSELIKIVK
jgi:HAD superfamily hydrolase (TIGR01549 family)